LTERKETVYSPGRRGDAEEKKQSQDLRALRKRKFHRRTAGEGPPKRVLKKTKSTLAADELR
jgi:hypothetical protein